MKLLQERAAQYAQKLKNTKKLFASSFPEQFSLKLVEPLG